MRLLFALIALCFVAPANAATWTFDVSLIDTEDYTTEDFFDPSQGGELSFDLADIQLENGLQIVVDNFTCRIGNLNCSWYTLLIRTFDPHTGFGNFEPHDGNSLTKLDFGLEGGTFFTTCSCGESDEGYLLAGISNVEFNLTEVPLPASGAMLFGSLLMIIGNRALSRPRAAICGCVMSVEENVAHGRRSGRRTESR